ncbi:Replicative DNA helicase (DnaB) [Labilithrix luteola]|uniref:Replicative DNA helicase (DnaB) n=1 Tax=Labilithrix luteola TaxID=1391654 RepID=A0A0K1QFK7_9BACT|nr:DnaB-like helicase C-terminal domain-containing protein [Labilithrix luteola]AKV04561.1 Replicative DNA helicase (DnaB) [Labilithrix luteola]
MTSAISNLIDELDAASTKERRQKTAPKREKPANDFDRGPANRTAAPTIASILEASIERAQRRSDGREKPILLPWPILADHFGGGLWPGLHVLNAGTGLGKTQLVLQSAAFTAKRKTPVLYIGLELGELDLALRLLGGEANVPWSNLWTGKAGPAHLARVREALPALVSLPFHFEVSRPHGFPASAVASAVEGFRALYPEPDGPGSRPLLVVVDFLQLIGAEAGKESELRIRIGQASYVLRELAKTLGVAIFAISSVARERLKIDVRSSARLEWDTDPNGCPINRRILDPDAIIGMGKESGDIEYSADSVSVMVRVPETWDGKTCDVIFATPKGRATGATWSPLRFTGYQYEECDDRGGRMVEAWQASDERRERVREEKKSAKEQKRLSGIEADAASIRTYVSAHSGCSVREARVNAVGDSARRWAPAVALLGNALVQTKIGSKVSLSIMEAANDHT